MIARRPPDGAGCLAVQSNGFATQNLCRAHYNARMFTPAIAANTHALKGWRARAWAWVLFVALLKGLIPHAALASVVMNGDPALVWCASGAAATGEGKTTGGMGAAAHDCVCAAAGDGALPQGGAALSPIVAAHQLPQPTLQTAAEARKFLSPPARGPPTL